MQPSGCARRPRGIGLSTAERATGRSRSGLGVGGERARSATPFALPPLGGLALCCFLKNTTTTTTTAAAAPPAPLPGGRNSRPIRMSQHPQPRPGAAPGPRPKHLSDALGTPGAVTWGTLRVRRATGPLRYSVPPGAAACPYLPATISTERPEGGPFGHCARNKYN